MFASVTFISDDYGEYGGVEYPPSPSRFVQAIIAGTQGDSKYMPLLRYLELVRPRIFATPQFTSYRYETYVPKNSWDPQRGQTFEQRNASTRKRVNVRLFSNPGPHVIYEYPIPDELVAMFEEAAGQVGVLGRAMDMTITRCYESRPAGDFDVFVPDATNTRGKRRMLNAPASGFIDSVFNRYRQREGLLNTAAVEYTENPQRELPRALFELTQPAPIEHATHVVAWARHAAMACASKDLERAISGHYHERLMIVPVPTLHYGDNRIHRLIVTGDNEKLVRAAESALAGLSLRDNEGRNRGYILPSEHDAVFAQFLHPSKRWISATPVLLSGHDDHDPRKRKRLLERMFNHSGLPAPVAIAEIKRKVKDFAVGAKHGHDKLHRMFCAVEFAHEVSGIVSAGTGRYSGLGIFANPTKDAAV